MWLIESGANYKLVTKSHLAHGQDGYSSLEQGTVLVNDMCAPTLTTAIQNHFQAIQVKNGKSCISTVHHQSLVRRSHKKEANYEMMEKEICKLEPRVEKRIQQMTEKANNEDSLIY